MYLWNELELKSLPDATKSFAMTPCQEVDQQLSKKDSLLKILDVRTPEEWDSGHIKDAIHIEIEQIPEKLKGLSKETTWGIVCASGYRASIVASQLQNAGFPSVFVLEGGMNAWQKNGLPIT